ncbi:pyridoxal phosphate-dependent aminotransferase [Lentzea sp.]|uniref:pyridoxal phosphate-dependent aminotransferase n=1 Tax=Lentzea sp. TaxID=56099 RepID=UPI002B5E83E5|nr:pyridoxal phosphate-dependent aminotransferase [Lentzea sp.]HUQ54079.1 pyridoxal phosphate-dependent aminotransferase [Lentzea sp.]
MNGPVPPRTASRVRGLISGRLLELLGEAARSAAVDLALGVPGAPETSPLLLDQACGALRSGHNQYEALAGNRELRRWIADTLPGDTDPDTELTITVGATEALTAAVLAVVDPGDEVVIFEPYYENFVNAVVLAGGVPRFVRTRPDDWRFDPAELRAAFGPRTRAVIVSTPNNPTGHMLDESEWSEIAALCGKWNAVVISDEIYSGFTFGKPHISVTEVPGLRDRGFLVGSLSKSHSVSGWRLGYLRASAGLTGIARQVHATLCAGAPGPLQEAVAKAAAQDPGFAKPSDDLRSQRDRVTGLLEKIGLECRPPDGGCYVMARIPPAVGESSDVFAHRLVREAGVLVAPGTLFHTDPAAGADHVRAAFNRSPDFLDEVAARLASFRTGASAIRL